MALSKMKTLFVTDLDGTLLNSSAKVSSFTVDTINKLIGRGMLFTVASARSIVSASKILKPLNLNLSGIFMNGVFLSNPWNKNSISVHFLKSDSIYALISAFELGGRPPFVFSFLGEKISEEEYETRISVEFKELVTMHDTEFYESRKKEYDMMKKVSNYSTEKVIYVNGSASYEKMKPIYESVSKIPGIKCVFYEDIYSHEWLLECFSDDASKPARAKELKKLYGADKLVCFGDNYNDIPMLLEADVKIAVKNAVPDLLNIADVIVDSNDKDGVAMFLDHHWNEV